MIKIYSKKYLDTITKTLLIGVLTTKVSYGDIVSHNEGRNIKTSENGNVIDIHPEEINGENAFNEFDEFGLDANKIANMYFDKDGNLANNLFNFVYDRIEIKGTVNAIKDNKIGGNLFFLSSEGMIVGSTGVVNAGSINMITPTKSYMNSIKGNRSLLTNNKLTTFEDIQSNKISLNPEGTITINGKLNASDEIKLRAGKAIYIGKNSIDTPITDAQLANNILKTGITDFKNLVNVGDLDPGITINTSEIGQDASGNIVLSAGGSSNYSEVEVNGNINASGSIEVSSEAETEYNGSNSVVENVQIALFDGVDAITSSDIQGTNISLTNESKITIGSDGSLIAKKDINIDSKANTSVKVNDTTLGVMVTDIKNISKVEISGDIKNTSEDINISSEADTHIDLSVEDSTPALADKYIPSVAFMYGDDENKSEIDINEGSTIDSQNKLNILSATTNSNSRNVKAATGDAGKVGIGINISEYTSDSKIKIDGELLSKEDISIESNNIIKKNSISTDTGLGSNGLPNINKTMKTAVVNLGKEVLKKFGKDLGSSELKDTFKFGGAVTYVDYDNSSNVVIGSNGKIGSLDTSSTNINSKVLVEDTNIYSKASVRSLNTGNLDKTSVSGGVVISNITNSSNITVEDSIDTKVGKILGKEINISSDVTMEYNRINNMKKAIDDSLEAFENIDPSDYPQDAVTKINEIKESLEKFLNEYSEISKDDLSDITFLERLEVALEDVNELTTVITDNLTYIQENFPTNAAVSALTELVDSILEFSSPTNYANFYASTKNKGSAQDAISVSGSFVYTDLDNSSEITLGRETEITSSGDINIDSNNNISAVSVGGEISGQKDGSAFGGTVSILENNVKSAINSLEGSKLIGGNININSNTDISNINIGTGFGSSKNGFNGSISSVSGDIENKISIDDETSIEGNKIEVNGKNDLSSINIAGSVSIGSEKTGSIGIGVTDYNIDVSSKIHDNDDEFSGSLKDITDAKIVTGELDVLAENTGSINTISASGTVTKNSDEEGKEPGIIDKIKEKYKSATDSIDSAIGEVGKLFDSENGETKIDEKMNPEEKISGDEKNESGDSGLTDSDGSSKVKINGVGSVSVNLIDKSTEAAVENVNIEFKEDKEDVLNVLGKDNQFIGAFSGAAGIQWNKGSKTDTSGGTTVGLAGAAAVNKIDKDISAAIKDTDILNSKEINVTSLSGGLEIAQGLGLQAANNSGAAYNGAASISLSLGDANLTSQMEDTNVNSDESSEEANIDVTTYKTDNQITGGATVQAGKMSVGGGLSVAINSVNNTIKSEIIGGTYKNIKNISVKSLMDSEIVNTAVAFGGAVSSEEGETATMLEGAVVYNDINNNVNSKISGATIEASGNVISVSKDVDEDSTSVASYKSLLETDAKNVLEDKNMAIDYDGSSFYSDQSVEYKNENNLESESDTESEKIKSDDESYGSSIVSVAVSVAGSDGNAAGAAVSINNITNSYTSAIENSTVSTTNNVESDSDFNSLLVNVAGGIAAGSDKFGGMGSVAWNNVENNINSSIESSTITGNKINLSSENTGKLVNVAGAFSYGGKASVGAALAYNNLENNIGSYLTGSNITGTLENSNVGLNSTTKDAIYNVAGGIGYSKNISISGVVAFNEVHGNIESKVDEDENNNKTKIKNIDEIKVNAENDTDVKDIAGNVTLGKVSVGGSVAYNNIGGLDSDNKKEKVLASINNATITNSNNIDIEAKDSSDLLTVGAGIAGSNKIAIQGAAGVSIVNKEVLGEMNNTEISNDENENEKTNVTVNSKNISKVFTSGDVISAGATGGIGVGIGVSKINEDTNSIISGGSIDAKNILVESDSNPNITSVGVGIGAGGKIGAAGSVTYNEIENSNKASIENGAKIISTGNVEVIANSENIISNYVGTVGVGGTAGAGISTSINKISGSTIAKISGVSTSIIASDSEEDEEKSEVVVEALSTNTTKSVIATVGVGGTAGGAGTVNINKLTGKTEAGIEDASIGNDDNKSKLSINAKDYSNSSAIVGSVSAAGTAALGGASDTNILDRDVKAYISKTAGNKDSENNIKVSDISVKADSKQNISSTTASFGVAGTAGLSGAVSVVEFDGKTKVEVSDYNITSDKDINLLASHSGQVNAGAFALGGGNNIGLGAGVTVVNSNDETGVEINNSSRKNLKAGNDINIGANNELKLEASSISAGVAGLGAGVSGTVEVNNLSNKVFTSINNVNISGKTVDISSINNVDFNNVLGSGSAGLGAIGAGVSYNTLNSSVKNKILNTDITASDSVNISGENIRDIKQTAVVAGLGGVSLNANILITKAGGEKLTTDVSEKLDYANSLQENKNEGSLGYNTEENNVDSRATSRSKDDTLTNNLTNANITGTNDLNIKLNDRTNVDITTVGAGASAVASAFSSVGIVDIDRNINTDIINSKLKSENAKVNIINNIGNIDDGSINLEMYQGTGSLGMSANVTSGEVTTSGNSSINLSNNSEIEGESVNIESADDTKVKVEASGISAGVLAAGAIITDGSNTGEMSINASDSNIKASETISIKTDKSGELDVNSKGGSFGIYSGTGVKSTGTDKGKSNIELNGTNLQGTNMDITATSSPKVSAEAGALGGSLVASAAVSFSEANVETQSNIILGSSNTFIGDNLNITSDITSDSKDNYTASAITKGVSAGGIAGVGFNESKSIVNSKSTVNIGKQNYNVSNINIVANNTTTQYSETYGITAGAVASGNNRSLTQSDKETLINVDGGTGENISITGSTTTDNEVKSQGHGGGLISVDGDGLAAKSTNNITSTTKININGNWNVENNMEILATEEDKVYVNANSVKASVVGVSGTKTENTIQDAEDGGTQININGDTNILGKGSLLAEAKNIISSGKKGEYNAEGGSYGGITVQGAGSTSNVDKTSTINIKDGASIKTDDSQKYKAYTNLKNYIYSSVKSAGLVSGLKSIVNNDININNTINVEKDTADNGYKLETLEEGGKITFNSSSDFESVANSKADSQGGAVGAATGSTNSNITKKNTINVNASIKSMDDVEMYAGTYETGIENNTKIETVAEVYNRTAVPVETDPKIENIIDQSNSISIGGDIDSVKDIYLSAKADDLELNEKSIKYRWFSGTDETGGYSTNAFGTLDTKGLTTDNKINITGDLVAGIQNEQKIKITGTIAPDGGTVVGVDSVDEPIFTFQGDIDEESVKFELMNYAATLKDRYDELTDLISEYREEELSQAYYGYVAEKQRIISAMEKYNMVGTDEDGGIFIRSEITIPTVEISNIVASGGNVILDTETLSGEGSLTAKGAPKIEIENNSNTYLKINDLKIGNLGGEVLYNNKNLNSGKLGSIDVATSDPGEASIDILNTWKGSLDVQVGYEDEDENYKTVKETFQPITSIEVNGNIENSLGTVNITNDGGDILIQGKTARDSASVNGSTVNLTAPSGSISQGFSEGIVNVGGDPLAKWSDVVEEVENKYIDPSNEETSATVNTDEKPIEYTGTMIAGDSIYINASDVNLNGYIQSGYADYVMNFSEDDASKIAALDKTWDGKTISDLVVMNNKKYKLNADGATNILDSDGHYMRSVDVYYNPSTKEIVTPDINTSGGQVYIMGRIASTGSGKIAALNGTSNVNFDTSSLNRTLKVGDIYTNNISGVVKIVDFNKLNVDGVEGLVTEYKDGVGGIYNPKDNLRYNWSTGKSTETKTYYTYTKKAYGWGMWSTKSGLEMIEKLNITGTAIQTDGDPKRSGEFISSEDSEFDSEYGYIYNNVLLDLSVSDVYKDVLKSYCFGAYKKIKYSWNSKKGESHNFLHSIKADYPITVEFFGDEVGSIDLKSDKNINLDGNIKVSNLDSTINLTAKEGIDFNNNYIIGDNINIDSNYMTQLNAKTLGSDLNLNIFLDTGEALVNVERTAGNSESKGNLNIENLKISDIGDITLSADGNIGSEKTISGNRVDLNSREGNINLKVNISENPINPNDTLSSSLNANAYGDITLSQEDGDLRIGTINSNTGDVKLTVSDGGLVDALPAGEQVSEGADELIENWEQMGLIGDNEDVLSNEEVYKEMKTEEFNDYTYLKSLDERTDNQENTYKELDTKYKDFSNIDEYLALDSTYKELQTSKWTEDQLLYSIKDSITHQKSSFGNKEIKDPNIIGKNITLNVNGGVGTDKATETVSLVNLMENKEALVKLSNAEASDVIWNNDTREAQINGKAPIGILMGEDGKVNINAKDNVYLVTKDMEGENKSQSIYIDNIKAYDGTEYKNIRINTDEGIFNANTEDTVNIEGNEIFLGSNGNIGDLNKYLRIDPHSYTKLESEKSIFVKGLNDINLGRVYASEDIYLEANNIYTDNDYIDGEGSINLKALVNIGSDDNYLQVANGSGLLNATGKNIYLSSSEAFATDGSLNLGDISSDNNLKVYSSKGISLKGNVTTDNMDVTAEDDIELVNEKETKGTNVEVTSKNGKINQGKNKLTISESSNFKAKNGINLENKENILTSVDLSNEEGNISIENNNDLDLNFKNSNNGLINVNNNNGNMNFLSDVLSTGDNAGINLSTNTGNIQLKNLNSEKDINVTAETGDIIGKDLTSTEDTNIDTVTGSIKLANVDVAGNNNLEITTGYVDIETSQVGKDNTITTDKGYIKLGSLDVDGNNTLETRNGNIDFRDVTTEGTTKISTTETGDITGTNLTLIGDTHISTKVGDINISNLVSEAGNVDISTEKGNILSDGEIASLNEALKVYSAEGDIKFNEIYSKNNTSITAGSGNINVFKADGENLIVVLKDQEKVLNVDNTVVGDNLSVFGNKMNFNDISQRDRDNKLTLNLKNSDESKSIEYVNIYNMKANKLNEILFDSLWVDNIYLNSDNKKISFPEINVVQLGHISNEDTNVTMFGQETVLDDADIDLWFKASKDKLWAKLDFNEDYHKITTDAKLVANKDYFYIFDQRISDVDSVRNEMGISEKINDFKNVDTEKKVDKSFKKNIVNNILENKPIFGENISNEIDFLKEDSVKPEIKILTFENNINKGEDDE